MCGRVWISNTKQTCVCSKPDHMFNFVNIIGLIFNMIWGGRGASVGLCDHLLRKTISSQSVSHVFSLCK